jgi:hypothetical protein
VLATDATDFLVRVPTNVDCPLSWHRHREALNLVAGVRQHAFAW